MSIREQIMALYDEIIRGVIPSNSLKYFIKDALKKAADLAEAREQELLERQAQMIAEIDEVIFDEYSGGYFHRLDIGGAEITDVLDKYRSTGNESND